MRAARTFQAIALISVLATGGCTRVARVPVASLLSRPDAEIRKQPGQRVFGYTDSLGSKHEFSGTALALAPDSIAFFRERPDLGHGEGGVLKVEMHREFVLSPAEAPRLHVKRFSAIKTVCLALSPIALFIAALAIGGGASINIGS